MNNGFLRDVGITQNQFNIGQQLLSAGIVIFEVWASLESGKAHQADWCAQLQIPINIILYRVGPTLCIGFQIIAWSVLPISVADLGSSIGYW